MGLLPRSGGAAQVAKLHGSKTAKGHVMAHDVLFDDLLACSSGAVDALATGDLATVRTNLETMLAYRGHANAEVNDVGSDELLICAADALTALDKGDLGKVRFNLKALLDGLGDVLDPEEDS
jgi:hypothetical protein